MSEKNLGINRGARVGRKGRNFSERYRRHY